MQMLAFNHSVQRIESAASGAGSARTANRGSQPLEARVKSECVHLYPGVDPATWYQVVQEGEYKDEMEGLWIQVSDWVTYVLARHFDLQTRRDLH
jgi:hypothetical protein